MAKTNLGRVVMLPKGEYSPSTSYDKLDVVTHEGRSYVCKINGTVGVAPSDSSRWQLLADKGERGDQGIQGIQGQQGIPGLSGAHVDDLVIEQTIGNATDRVMSQQAVSQELSSLAQKMDDVLTKGGTFEFDPKEVIQEIAETTTKDGYFVGLSNGAFSASSNFISKEFSCEGDTEYLISGSTGSGSASALVAWLGNSGLIKVEYGTNVEANKSKSFERIKLTSPTNATIVRIEALKTGSVSVPKLEKSTIVTDKIVLKEGIVHTLSEIEIDIETLNEKTKEVEKIGNTDNLNTTDKSSIVGSINEIASKTEEIPLSKYDYIEQVPEASKSGYFLGKNGKLTAISGFTTNTYSIVKGNEYYISGSSGTGNSSCIYAWYSGENLLGIAYDTAQTANRGLNIFREKWIAPEGADTLRVQAKEDKDVSSPKLEVYEKIVIGDPLAKKSDINLLQNEIDGIKDKEDVGSIKNNIILSEGGSLILTGASFAVPANGWFELSCQDLGVTAVNKAVAGSSVMNAANSLINGTLYSTDELIASDALVLMHVHNYNIMDESKIKDKWSDYTSISTTASDANYAAAFDYIVKRYIHDCRENSKPVQIIVCTSWHDGREKYNNAARRFAKKWSATLVDFAKNIGFSKDMPNEDGSQVSLLYAASNGGEETIDGVVYGWHPATGNTKYIQKKMAKIFVASVK